jgi:hypothetical protein
LRYGIIIGALDDPVPKRLVRHGHDFDFMMTVANEKLTGGDRDRLVALILVKVRASQTIGRILAEKSETSRTG